MINKNEYLVTTRTQQWKCGAGPVVIMDQVVKAANYEDEYFKTIIVFRSKKHETKNKYVRISTADHALKPASAQQISDYEAGVINCKAEGCV